MISLLASCSGRIMGANQSTLSAILPCPFPLLSRSFMYVQVARLGMKIFFLLSSVCNRNLIEKRTEKVSFHKNDTLHRKLALSNKDL